MSLGLLHGNQQRARSRANPPCERFDCGCNASPRQFLSLSPRQFSSIETFKRNERHSPVIRPLEDYFCARTVEGLNFEN